jgi:PadR family transcriptional regulator PadR
MTMHSQLYVAGCEFTYRLHRRGISGSDDTDMTTKHQNDRLQGTLDLLILKVIDRAELVHGYAIAQRIQQATDDYLRIEEGSLYPALHRMTNYKWLKAEWGTTETNRKARFYRITAAGRRQLQEEETRWTQLTAAVGKALRFA